MVELRIAETNDKELYRNMFNMYQNDLSAYNNELSELDDNGYFDRETVECFFDGNKSVLPYVILKDNKIAGCVLFSKPPFVKPGCDYCIQELFVLGLYRGKGVAADACSKLFKEFKGRYCILVLKENQRAIKFWTKLINKNGIMIGEGVFDEKGIYFEFITK
jgi:predicted acetyltransferase